MSVPNDIDFTYHLWPHGWSTATLWIDREPLNFWISHIFNDPLGELADSTKRLAKGENFAEFSWSDEPGAYLWRLNRLPAERHLLEVTIAEHSEDLATLTDRTFRSERRFLVARDFWIHLAYTALSKIATSFEFRHFKASRGQGEFPWQEYHELKRVVHGT